MILVHHDDPVSLPAFQPEDLVQRCVGGVRIRSQVQEFLPRRQAMIGNLDCIRGEFDFIQFEIQRLGLDGTGEDITVHLRLNVCLVGTDGDANAAAAIQEDRHAGIGLVGNLACRVNVYRALGRYRHALTHYGHGDSNGVGDGDTDPKGLVSVPEGPASTALRGRVQHRAGRHLGGRRGGRFDGDIVACGDCGCTRHVDLGRAVRLGIACAVWGEIHRVLFIPAGPAGVRAARRRRRTLNGGIGRDAHVVAAFDDGVRQADRGLGSAGDHRHRLQQGRDAQHGRHVEEIECRLDHVTVEHRGIFFEDVLVGGRRVDGDRIALDGGFRNRDGRRLRLHADQRYRQYRGLTGLLGRHVNFAALDQRPRSNRDADVAAREYVDGGKPEKSLTSTASVISPSAA